MTKTKTGVIYRITAPNGKSYIGQTVDYKKRMEEHQKEDSGCIAIRDAIKKYGWDKMVKTILARNMTKEQMDREETNLIKIYDTFGENGYNLTKGGDGVLGCKLPPRTDKYRAKLSASGKVAMNRSDVKSRISAALMGKKKTEKTKARMSAAKKGRKHPPRTDEARANNSAAKKGQNNPMSAANKRRRFIAKCFEPKDFFTSTQY